MISGICAQSAEASTTCFLTAMVTTRYFLQTDHCQRLKVSNPQENITCSPHTSSSSDYLPHGAVCRITCQSGFGIKNGSSTLTCKGTGAWSAPTPTCSKCENSFLRQLHAITTLCHWTFDAVFFLTSKHVHMPSVEH